MTTTVYFATNRVVNAPGDRTSSYTHNIVSPLRPQDVTYGTAFVNTADLTADTVGRSPRSATCSKAASRHR